MNPKIKKLVWGAAIVVAVVSLYLSTIFLFWLSNGKKIYPGVSVAGVNLSGKNEDQAREILTKEAEKALSKGIFLDGEKIEDIGVVFDVNMTVQKAIQVGKNNPFFLGFKREVPLGVKYDQAKVYETLKAKEEKYLKPAINSKISSQNSISVQDGEPGKRLNYAETAYGLSSNLSALNSSFRSSFYEVGPTFTSEDLKDNLDEINSRLPEKFTLIAKEKEYELSNRQLASFAILKGERRSLAKLMAGETVFEPLFGTKRSSIFSEQLISDYLGSLEKNINVSSANAILGTSQGKVIVSKAEVNGQKLDISDSVAEIIQALEDKKESASLVIEVEKPEIRADNLSELGLVELLSTGYSNFSGSPANRIHNINTGASKFNGVLIRPNEEFSFNKTLGPVDASTGYLPELVILENKTQPQFGGGLCQVSSTAFRAALNAGLPILERKAHAYPVSYYKPFGVDATIYLPRPDLKFKNDTGKYIFVQTRISGRNLSFDFYGTKPVRNVTFAGNEAAAGAVFPVEKVSPGLYDQGARGNGSFTAIFYRFVTDAAGKVTSSKFISKYDSPDKYPH